jgi:hypothetical protein
MRITRLVSTIIIISIIAIYQINTIEAAGVSLNTPYRGYYFINNVPFTGTISGGVASEVSFYFTGRASETNNTQTSSLVTSIKYNPPASYSYNDWAYLKKMPVFSGYQPQWTYMTPHAIINGVNYVGNSVQTSIVKGSDSSYYTQDSPYFYYYSATNNSFRGMATSGTTYNQYTYNCLAYALGYLQGFMTGYGYTTQDIINYIVDQGYTQCQSWQTPQIIVYQRTSNPGYWTHVAKVNSWSSGTPTSIISKWGIDELIYSQSINAFTQTTYGSPYLFFK